MNLTHSLSERGRIVWQICCHSSRAAPKLEHYEPTLLPWQPFVLSSIGTDSSAYEWLKVFFKSWCGKCFSVIINCKKYSSVKINCKKYFSVKINCRRYFSVIINFKKYFSVKINCKKYFSVKINCKKYFSVKIDCKKYFSVKKLKKKYFSVKINCKRYFSPGQYRCRLNVFPIDNVDLISAALMVFWYMFTSWLCSLADCYCPLPYCLAALSVAAAAAKAQDMIVLCIPSYP